MNEELVIQIKAEISDLKKQVNEANKHIKGIGTDGSKSVEKLNSALKSLGKVVAATFSVAAITNFAKEIVKCSAEVAAEESAFAQIMGDYADTAYTKMSKVADGAGMVESRLTGYMTSLTAKFSGLGFGIEEATSLATQGLTMAADASAFWDMSLDEATSHLNSFINGSYEGGEAIGLFANDTQMAMYAVESGVIGSTKAWAQLDEATKQATRLAYAQNMMDLSGATGQAAKEAESFANIQANLNEKWRIFKAEIGAPVLQNIAIPGMKMLSGAIDVASQAYEDFCAWLPTGKAYIEELGTFVRDTFAPAFEILIPVFQQVVEFFSPIVDKVRAYITEGGLASDASSLLYSTISLLGDIAIVVAEAFAAVVDKLMAMKQWVSENETAVTLIAVAIGALTTAIVAYNVAQAIANAGGVAAIAQNAALTVGYYALVAAETVATAATSAFGAVMAFVTSPITLVVAAIAAVIAIIVLCVQHWEEIREVVRDVVDKIAGWMEDMKEAVGKAIDKVIGFFQKVVDFIQNNWQGLLLLIVNPFAGAFKLAYDNCEGFRTKVNTFVENVKNGLKNGFEAARSAVVNIFEKIKSGMTEKINAAATAVKNVIDKIKGFFNFKFNLPHIPKPSFSISPSGWKIGDLLKGSIPKLSIAWHAQGGVFDKPTIMPYGGSLHGLGENGAEAIVPLEKNTQWLDRMAEMIVEKTHGSQPVVIEVDGKVFGKTAISTINQNTKQTGKLALVW